MIYVVVCVVRFSLFHSGASHTTMYSETISPPIMTCWGEDPSKVMSSRESLERSSVDSHTAQDRKPLWLGASV